MVKFLASAERLMKRGNGSRAAGAMFIVLLIVSIASAILTALGATSCMGL